MSYSCREFIRTLNLSRFEMTVTPPARIVTGARGPTPSLVAVFKRHPKWKRRLKDLLLPPEALSMVRERSSGYVELYPAKDGRRWRFVAGNGLILADSAEAYTEMRHACEAAQIVCALPAEARFPINWKRQEHTKRRWYR